MEIKTYNFKKHYGCEIFIRNIGEIWEYLTVIKGKIYTAYITVKMKPLQRQYNQKEIEGAISYIGSMALATVEAVLGKTQPSEDALGKDVIKAVEGLNNKVKQDEKNKKS